MGKFTDAVLAAFAMPRALSEAVAAALLGPESHARLRYANQEQRDLDRMAMLEDENARLRAALSRTIAERNEALRLVK